MSDTIEWTQTASGGDLAERAFVLKRESGEVPGVLWLPAAVDHAPAAVMVGHGGSSDKRSPRVLEIARWLTTNVQIAVVAIDGPFHGDRVPAPITTDQYQALIAAEGAEAVLQRITDDWLATVEQLGSRGHIDPGRLGYIGMSMAARYGIPVAAAAGDRMKAVVLGKFGLVTGALPTSMDTSARILADAPRISAPTLFHLQWDDEVYDRGGQLELFARLGASDKRLHAYPGKHAVATPEAVSQWLAFIAGRLGPGAARADH